MKPGTVAGPSRGTSGSTAATTSSIGWPSMARSSVPARSPCGGAASVIIQPSGNRQMRNGRTGGSTASCGSANSWPSRPARLRRAATRMSSTTACSGDRCGSRARSSSMAATKSALLTPWNGSGWIASSCPSSRSRSAAAASVAGEPRAEAATDGVPLGAPQAARQTSSTSGRAPPRIGRMPPRCAAASSCDSAVVTIRHAWRSSSRTANRTTSRFAA